MTPPDEPSSISSLIPAPFLAVHTHNSDRGPGIAKARNHRATSAQCLRQARERLGWTIGRAATIYGCTPRTWSSWEHGRTMAEGDAVMWIMSELRARRTA